MKKYVLYHLEDEKYQLKLDDYYGEVVYQGTMVECDAWLRLNENGYL